MSGSLSNEFLRKLLIRYREGDDEAFAEFADTMRGFLLSVAYRVVLDFHVAEDVCQEALLKMARAVQRGSWRPKKGKIQAWARTIARRAAIEKGRKRRLWHTDGMVAFTPTGPEKADGAAPSLLELLEHREAEARLREWLARHATETERLVILSRFYVGMTLQKVGEVLEVEGGPAAVHRLCGRAVANLRTFLGEGSPG
jgi:RNA polymerase sigma-70 factor (ECF subfamily)